MEHQHQRDPMQSAEQLLRTLDITPTAPRIAVLRALDESRRGNAVIDSSSPCSDEHLTAEQLYLGIRLADQQVSLGTVYRTLSLLKRAGVVQSVALDGGKLLYQLRVAMPRAPTPDR